MKASEVRSLGRDEIQKRIADLQQTLFSFRFQNQTGQLENPRKIAQTKRDVARLKTILREWEFASLRRRVVSLLLRTFIELSLALPQRYQILRFYKHINNRFLLVEKKINTVAKGMVPNRRLGESTRNGYKAL